ncbi:MAG: YifB family Mg chelatase-like AAA ATPase, partial [Bacteroidales bacterium]|nr:YifB family Mg chelatase-like AAA ATPase [Bacteroidales bacterium]
ATTVTVEVEVSDGICFYLVGLADNAIKESQQRIGSALGKFGYRIPGKKIIINLAPANLRKEGSAFDAAIAIGILTASGQIETRWNEDFLIMGELALDGSLRPIDGALPIAIHAAEKGFKGCILPKESAAECSEVDGTTIFYAQTLEDIINILTSPDTASSYIPLRREYVPKKEWEYDFADVKGQAFAKKGLEIAAAGGHNAILVGSPGCGKTFMAKCIPSILPPMEKQEAIETSKVYSIAGLLKSAGGLIRERPFRSPHHTSTIQSLAGSLGMPGEVSLAHNGVLFADEIAEFGRASLEILRQPLEDREIQVCRAKTRVCYPASFMLIAAMNPCPCGYLNDPKKNCTCSSSAIMKYAGKLSGPLMDRIDIQLNVKSVSPEDIVGLGKTREEPSREIAKRVKAARDIQLERFKGENFYTNAQIPAGKLAKYCRIGEREQLFLKNFIARQGISARGYSRILKISRTIADLDGKDFISLEHISKAVQLKLNINDF